MGSKRKHIVIDARIRRASTGRPVDRLLEHLQALDTGYKYTILLEPNDSWRPSNRQFKTTLCKYRQFSLNPFQQIAFAWQLYRLKPDLVHFTLTGQQPLFYLGHQITFTHDLTMLKYARRGRLPKWVHRLRMRGYRLLLWSAHKKALRVLVPTKYVEDALHKYHLFTGRKLVTTLEACDTPISSEPIPPAIMKPDPISTNPQLQFLLYVGSAFPHKNLRRLIKSFKIILAKYPDMKLVLAGNQEYHAKKLQRWSSKKSYEDHIIFTGFVSDVELKWLYENASAYVFPSLSEGFGLPGLEAMAHGCPVVSSNATCLPEVYGDGAHYFDPEDIEDMAKSISKVLRGEEFRQDLIKKGYSQTKKYSWRKTAEQTLAVYDEILSN